MNLYAATIMDQVVTYNDIEDEDKIAEGQTSVHEYYFEYDTDGETTLEHCLIDVLAFVLDGSRNEAERTFRRETSVNIDGQFSMLDSAAKSMFTLRIEKLQVNVHVNGEIIVREQ